MDVERVVRELMTNMAWFRRSEGWLRPSSLGMVTKVRRMAKAFVFKHLTTVAARHSLKTLQAGYSVRKYLDPGLSVHGGRGDPETGT